MTAKSSWFAKFIRMLAHWFKNTRSEQRHVERDDHPQGDRGVFAI